MEPALPAEWEVGEGVNPNIEHNLAPPENVIYNYRTHRQFICSCSQISEAFEASPRCIANQKISQDAGGSRGRDRGKERGTHAQPIS